MSGTGRLLSPLVVLSWWANCLALDCLERLRAQPRERSIYVLQAGKSAEQKARFRACLPPGIIELDHPAHLPGEHSRVVQYVAFEQLAEQHGLWLVDHDVFFQADLEGWLQEMDTFLQNEGACLCLPRRQPGTPANTSPLFWLSPQRWPKGTPGIDPVPFQERDESRRPDLYRGRLALSMPQKDTLMLAKEALQERGMVRYYPLWAEPGEAALPLLPEHAHLGGLSLFASQLPVELYQTLDWFRGWMQQTVEGFSRYYAACPPAWLAVEDPILLQRLEEYQEFVHGG